MGEHNAKTATRYGTDYEALKRVLEHPQARYVFDPDAEGAEEVADPYVLALGLHLRTKGFEAIIVQQEKQKHDRPGKISLSTACVSCSPSVKTLSRVLNPPSHDDYAAAARAAAMFFSRRSAGVSQPSAWCGRSWL